MSRTSKRPVPSGLINPARNALIFGIILVFTGIAVAAVINWLAAIFIFLGFLDSAVIYNLISKRRSPLNIILGAPAGGMTVFAGWSAVAGIRIDLIAVLMFLLIMVWTPVHIWSLAYFYREDYQKADVPMLPVIWSSRNIFLLLLILNAVLVFLSVFIGFYFSLSIFYLIFIIILGVAMMVLNIILFVKNSRKFAWILFKFSSPDRKSVV